MTRRVPRPGLRLGPGPIRPAPARRAHGHYRAIARFLVALNAPVRSDCGICSSGVRERRDRVTSAGIAGNGARTAKNSINLGVSWGIGGLISFSKTGLRAQAKQIFAPAGFGVGGQNATIAISGWTSTHCHSGLSGCATGTP